MRAENPEYPNFLSKSDLPFKTLHIAMDKVFKKLKSDCVGADAKHTEGISLDEELKIWESGVNGVDTSTALLRAVFFVCGKSFCLRGGS